VPSSLTSFRFIIIIATSKLSCCGRADTLSLMLRCKSSVCQTHSLHGLCFMYCTPAVDACLMCNQCNLTRNSMTLNMLCRVYTRDMSPGYKLYPLISLSPSIDVYIVSCIGDKTVVNMALRRYVSTCIRIQVARPGHLYPVTCRLSGVNAA